MLYSSLILGFLIVWLGSPRARGGEIVTLYTPFQAEMAVEKYVSPILYTDDKFEILDSNASEPSWMRAFVNFRRPDLQVFKTWREGFTDAYLERNDITEDAHAKSSAMRKRIGPVQTKNISFLWTLWIKANGREFAYVASYQYGHLSKFPEKRSDLQFALNILSFEKISGKWRMQVVDPVPEIRALPLGNLDAINTIIQVKSAVIQGPASARPLKILP